MKLPNSVDKPILRKPLRQLLGKEYFILKRRWKWIVERKKWARQVMKREDNFKVFQHKSMILRPLKDVDMYLQENKRTNLRLAIEKIHLTEIKPGETFSLWKQVGRPTKGKGYLDGLVLKQGTIAKGTGGGLCQLGNLLFWMVAHSPLTVVERHRHGFDVFPDVNRNIPFGSGATLSYNYIDLQIENRTEQSFQFELWLDETHLNGKITSNKQLTSTYIVREENHLMKQQMWGGYTRHNQLIKVEKLENGEEFESLLVENHAIMMYNPFLQE